jgi:hypothetical protein
MSLAYLGDLLVLIGTIWMLFVAFQESILWGIGCLLIPLVVIVFTIQYWNEAKKPFQVWLAGWILAIISYHMSHPAPVG